MRGNNILLDKDGRDAMFKDMADTFNKLVEEEQAKMNKAVEEELDAELPSWTKEV